jgi:hypothetical protein
VAMGALFQIRLDRKRKQTSTDGRYTRRDEMNVMIIDTERVQQSGREKIRVGK